MRKVTCYGRRALQSRKCVTAYTAYSTTLFSLSDDHILSREWRVVFDQVQTNYHGSHMVL